MQFTILLVVRARSSSQSIVSGQPIDNRYVNRTYNNGSLVSREVPGIYLVFGDIRNTYREARSTRPSEGRGHADSCVYAP